MAAKDILRSPETERLFQAILSLESYEECASFLDLVIGKAREQHLGRFQSLGHIAQLLDGAQVLQKRGALLIALQG